MDHFFKRYNRDRDTQRNILGHKIYLTIKVTELIFQDNELLSRHREYRYMPDKMTWDPNCYECKVRYRDPKANDLVMYLHAWRYKVNNS